MAVKRTRNDDQLAIFIPITKIDEEKRLVYGCLAAEEVDAADEIFDYDSSKPLFEKWSQAQYDASGGLSKGNVRSMHTSIAAGKLTELEFDDASKLIEGCAKVVDDAEWNKVLEGVYTGFSMGGKYVRRWKDGDNTRYTARPVEMSLVDSPCIKSATFSVIKSDGSVEDRLFKGVSNMFEPTNDAILARATELAKAAGKEGDGDWLEFSDLAKAALIEEHDAVEKAKPNPFADGAKDGDDKDAAPKDETPEEKAAREKKEKEDAAKADLPADQVEEGNLEQVWKAKDGSTHAKKADAIAHNEKLAKGEAIEPEAEASAAEPSLTEQLAALKADVATIASEGGEPVVVVGFDALPADEQLGKLIEFLDTPDVLAKGLYEVSRTANAMRDIASLYITVAREAKQEGDGSTVPATLLTAVDNLGAGLIAMATEEVGEVMERLREKDADASTPEVEVYYYPDSYCALAASTLGLEKADATAFFNKAISISGKDQARLQKMHDHSVALGATCAKCDEEDGADAEADADKIAKAEGLQTENTDLKKRLDEAMEQISAATPLIKGIREELDILKATARPRAPVLTVLGKGEDGPGGPGSGTPLGGAVEDQLAALVTKYGSQAMADAMIKISHQQPHRMG